MTPKKLGYAAVLLVGMMGSGYGENAMAQTAAGPLAKMDAAADAPKTARAKKSHPIKSAGQTKNKTVETAKPAVVEPWAAVDPARVAPTPSPEAPAPSSSTKALAGEDARPNAHPDLAMKWNGSNDTATQTRVQNYGGDAEGAGAAMGLKFHF